MSSIVLERRFSFAFERWKVSI